MHRLNDVTKMQISHIQKNVHDYHELLIGIGDARCLPTGKVLTVLPHHPVTQ